MENFRKKLSVKNSKCPFCQGQLYESPYNGLSYMLLCNDCYNEFSVHPFLGVFSVGLANKDKRFSVYDGVPSVKAEILSMGFFKAIFSGYFTKWKYLKKINRKFNIDEKNSLLKEIKSIEEWKQRNCFNILLPECKECMSGGIFIGSYCNLARENGIENERKEMK